MSFSEGLLQQYVSHCHFGCLSFYHMQIGSGAHPAHYPVGIGGSVPGGKAIWG